MDKVNKYIKAIQDTSNDAFKTKICSSNKNYFTDKYILEFSNKHEPIPKMLPIINRGTWSRVFAITSTVDKVVNSLKINIENKDQRQLQIINLGAGLDTLYFNLKDKYEDQVNLKFIELDYEQIVQKKVEFIQKSDLLKSRLSSDVVIGMIIFYNFINFRLEYTKISSKDYHLISIDLIKTDAIIEELNKLKIDYSIPTILIAECFLVYLTRKVTMNILNVFTSNFKNLIFTFYDLINPHDPFGQEMLDNLRQRNIKLNGIEETDSIDKQITRLKDCGFLEYEVHDMVDFYNHFIDNSEKKKIEKLELFDEFEEWNLLQSHSCYGLGIKLEKDYEFLYSIKFKKY